MAHDRTGLLIIRARVEKDSANPLRAQVRLATDVAGGLEPPLNLASEEGVVAVVREWLAGVLANDTPAQRAPESP